MDKFRKKIGERLELKVSGDGARMHEYGYGCSLRVREGWNSSCSITSLNLSVDDLRDLQYLIVRALATVDSKT